MALESETNSGLEIIHHTENPTTDTLSTNITQPLSLNVPPPHFDAPPAYTPFSSSTSLVQGNNPVTFMKFLDLEIKAFRVLAIGSIILGSVSLFVSVLAIAFGTLMYCTGTGIWGGLFAILNGLFCLIRYCRLNSRNVVRSLCVFSGLTIVACIVSVILSVIGTAGNLDMCCHKTIINVATGIYMCNYNASELANTLSTCIGFVLTIFTVLTTALYAKYSSICCHDTGDEDNSTGISSETNSRVFLPRIM